MANPGHPPVQAVLLLQAVAQAAPAGHPAAGLAAVRVQQQVLVLQLGAAGCQPRPDAF